MRPLAILLLVLGLAVVLPAGPGQAAASPATAASRQQALRAITVLHSWDTRRARAWAASDERALRSLYLRGSSAGRSDVRLLRSYEARGLVVRRLVTQVFGVRLLRRGPRTISLRVLDRVAGGIVTRAGRDRQLASSKPVVRRIDLVLAHGAWRVSAVSSSG